MSTIRRDPIYLTTEVWRWLRLLAKAETNERGGGVNGPITVDEIADQILRQAIREQHPQLADHQKQIEKLEKQLVEALQQGKKNEPNYT